MPSSTKFLLKWTQFKTKPYQQKILNAKIDPNLNNSLTTDDKLALQKILTNFNANNNPTIPKSALSHNKYIEDKALIVKDIFGDDPDNKGYLNYVFPKDKPNPYYDAVAVRKVDPESGAFYFEGKNRLSVTKLITKSWCELREAYDAYSKVAKFERPYIRIGKREHSRLEAYTHPIPEDWESFVEDFEIPIPDDDFHRYVQVWFDCNMRMVDLFRNGVAREILCQGYLNTQTGKFNESRMDERNDIHVSGIIDHLFLKDKNASIGVRHRSVDFSKAKAVVSSSKYDLQIFISWLWENIEDLKSRLELVVSDVKTRSLKMVPTQATVVQGSKFQVMYYRYFLQLMGKNSKTTYENILSSAKIKGYDVDKPIDPAKIVSLMVLNDFMMSDMIKLRDGENIGFEPYDMDRERLDSVSETYDMTNFLDSISDAQITEKFEDFFTAWKTPVTLRYLAARQAQLYELMSQLLSDKLMIEYYRNGQNFHNIVFKFDAEEIQEQASNSADFWMGRRNPEPIIPTVNNLTTYCKHCDYKKYCSWSNKGEQNNRDMGKDLAQIFEENMKNRF